MDSFWRDLKYALRTLAKSPGFTLIAVLSLALGIGANTAIFTLTNAVFLNPLPVEDGARLIQLYTVDHATTTTLSFLNRTPVSFLNFKDIRAQNNVFSDLAAFVQTGVALTGRGEAKPENAMLVTANYFDVLGVKPAIGRTFLPEEDRSEGGNPVTVLSYSMWMRLFAGSPAAIGKTAEFNGIPYTVVGVAPQNFKGTLSVGSADLAFLPLSMHMHALPAQWDKLFNERRMRLISPVGRLKPGVQPAQAAANLAAIASTLERDYPRANAGRTITISSLSDAALGFIPREVMLTAGLALSAIVGLVLLIACVNLANLLLARLSKRTREMGIRTALGAERGRLVRQLLTESLLLSVAGGVGGLALGYAGSRLFWSFRPVFLPQDTIALRMDWRVFLFTAAVAAFTGLLFSIVPAARMSVTNLSEILKTGGRGGTEAYARNRLRSVLVVGEVSLALVALAAAGLLIRSMDRVQQINPGFETRNLFAVNFDFGSHNYAPERGLQFERSVIEKARAVPGVRSAALAVNRPFGFGLLATILIEGQDTDPTQHGSLASLNTVSPEYFDTLRIPLREGRGISEFDRQGTTPVAVITEAMARHFWPGQNAVGKRFRLAVEDTYRQVVGVCANSVVFQIGEQPQPIAYLPLRQNYQPAMALDVRTDGNPADVMPAVLKQVQSLDPNMALTLPSTIEDLISQGLWAPRMLAGLFGIFGILGMVLASIGIYGVMSYVVAQRTNEIGLRMALGARPWDVLRLVVGQGMRLAVAGILLGIVGGLAVTRGMSGLLFSISPDDPVTFGTVSLVLAAVAFFAGWLPARRAARIDPMLALRQE